MLFFLKKNRFLDRFTQQLLILKKSENVVHEPHKSPQNPKIAGKLD